MADYLNALIASGGGYEPPRFDYLNSVRQINMLKGEEADTALKQAALESGQNEVLLQKRLLEINKLTLDIENSFQNLEKGKERTVEFPWGTITGKPEDVIKITREVRKYPTQFDPNDPIFQEYIAKSNVDFKLREPGTEKNQTEEQLTARALRGDTEAQGILDAMRKRRLEIAGANRAIIVNNPMPAPPPNPDANQTLYQLIHKLKTTTDPVEKQRIQEELNTMADFQAKASGLKAEETELGKIKGANKAPSLFDEWTPEQKEQSFENFIVNNQKPAFTWRDMASKNKWEKEYNQYLINKGTSSEDVGERRYYRTALGRTLSENERRETLTRDFVNRIDQNINTIKELQKKYGPDYGRLFNKALNAYQQGVPGSGDLESLRLAIISTSNEVAKIESGSLGIAGASVDQMKQMAKIHDVDLNPDDMRKVLETSSALGKNSVSAIADENERVRRNLKAKGGIATKEKTVVERRKSKTGKTLVKYSDGTIGEE